MRVIKLSHLSINLQFTVTPFYIEQEEAMYRNVKIK
jgi:hypothetical protein